MATYLVEAAVMGTAWVFVEADSEEDAVKKSQSSGDWKIDDWDLNTEPYQGGYITAQEE